MVNKRSKSITRRIKKGLGHEGLAIGGGIDQGFAEARGILDGLGVLEGELKDNIDLTYDLVQQGLQAFREGFSSADEVVPEDQSQ